MAIDTKPNLNKDRFEQFSGEELNLSGCTNVYGGLIIKSGATLSIKTNAGVGKVPVSDSLGNLTLQNLQGGDSVTYQGEWNAATNNPTLPNASGVTGNYYVVNSGGTYNNIDFRIRDWVISDGTEWDIVRNHTAPFFLTQAEYDALTEQEKSDTSKFYLIEDEFVGSGITSVLNVGVGGGLVYKDINGTNLRLRTILGSGSTTVSTSGDTIIVYSVGGVGSATWGSITGTISNQTDLNNCLNSKQATITGGATTITTTNLTANRALISDVFGKVAVGTVTSTELNYLTGTTSNIQTQLNDRVLSTTYNTYVNTTAPSQYASKTNAITGATNLGSGNGSLYTTVSGNKLNLKSLSGGTNVTLTCNGNYVTISSTGGGGSVGGANGSLQYNDNGSFGGSSSFNYDDSLNTYSMYCATACTNTFINIAVDDNFYGYDGTYNVLELNVCGTYVGNVFSLGAENGLGKLAINSIVNSNSDNGSVNNGLYIGDLNYDTRLVNTVFTHSTGNYTCLGDNFKMGDCGDILKVYNEFGGSISAGYSVINVGQVKNGSGSIELFTTYDQTPNKRISILRNGTYTFSLLGSVNGTQSSGCKIEGVFMRSGATSQFIGTPVCLTLGETVVGCHSFSVHVDSSTCTFRVCGQNNGVINSDFGATVQINFISGYVGS